MKSNRHEKILEIIKNHDVETQEEASKAEEKPGRKGRKTAAE